MTQPSPHLDPIPIRDQIDRLDLTRPQFSLVSHPSPASSSTSTTPTMSIVPPVPTHPTIGRGLAAKPDTYDGNKAKYKAWWRSVNLYLNDPFNGIIDEGHKINTVISLIRGPDVDTWVENYYDDNYDEGTGKWKSTWAALIAELQQRFVDANAEKLAQMKLENLQQGKDTAEDFFQQFEGLIKKAGYDKKHTYLITLLERNVHASIIDTIYRGTALPAVVRERDSREMKTNKRQAGRE